LTAGKNNILLKKRKKETQIKYLIIILFVIAAFAIMLAGMFFGDYKKMRTKYNREKKNAECSESIETSSACPGCSGTGCC